MVIGNWSITEDGIRWTGDSFQRFVIPIEQLGKTRQTRGSASVVYDWILLATAEDWLSEDDLYDLNFAFVFAAGKFGIAFDYDIFDATLEEQYEQFDAEENDDPDI